MSATFCETNMPLRDETDPVYHFDACADGAADLMKLNVYMDEERLEAEYDRVYYEPGHTFFAGQPDSVVEKLCHHLQSGLVLELGAGQGRNALWLARRGLSVDATDISSVGLQQIAE